LLACHSCNGAFFREPDLEYLNGEILRSWQKDMVADRLLVRVPTVKERYNKLLRKWTEIVLLVDNPALYTYAYAVIDNECDKALNKIKYLAFALESRLERRLLAPQTTRLGRETATKVRSRLHPDRMDLLTTMYHAGVYLRWIHNLDSGGLGAVVRSELAGRRKGAEYEDVYKDWWDRMQPFKVALARRDLPPYDHKCLEPSWPPVGEIEDFIAKN